jgi:hypothetical protein
MTLKGSRTVATGGVEKRALGYRALHRPTHGTPFHGKHVEPDQLVWAVAALAEGLGIRAGASVFAVDPNTGLQWLMEVAAPLETFSHHVLHDVHVDQVQLDALFALRRFVAGEPPAAPPVTRPTTESATAEHPVPRYGRSPRLQQVHAARQAARAHRYQDVQTRAARGQSLQQIAQASGVSRHTVRHWLRTATLPPDQRGYRGPGNIDAYLPSLQTRLAEGCTNQSRLWRESREQGFTGTRSLVAKGIHAHGPGSPVVLQPAAPTLPAARQLAWMLFQDADKRTAEAQALGERLQQQTELAHGQELVQQGAAIIRQRQADAFEPWLRACRASPRVELRNFADELQRDAAAVHAALTLPWSTGPVEGHINRLKLIKRSGYGRMQLDLLRQRVLYDAA